MPKETTPTETDERGDETHPSFALVGLSNVTSSPGAHLFDSEIPHGHYVTLSIKRAKRQRSLNRDVIFGREELIEVSMSKAQFGSMISSFNQGDGVPCTLSRFQGELVPEAPFAPRLAESVADVKDATKNGIQSVVDALADVTDAFQEKAGRRDMTRKLHHLQCMVDNMPSNMTFAADSLTKHTENALAKVKADLEAMVMDYAERAGLDAGDTVSEVHAALGTGSVIDADAWPDDAGGLGIR